MPPRPSEVYDLIPIPEKQDTPELQGRTRLGGQAVNQDVVARGHAVLLSTADDDSRQ